MTRISMTNCSRCGRSHTDLDTEKLENPFAPPECAPIVWTHWVRCPTNGQPVMVKHGDPNAPRSPSDVPEGTGQEQLEYALPIVFQVYTARTISLGSELEAFKSTVREFFGKWKPSA